MSVQYRMYYHRLTRLSSFYKYYVRTGINSTGISLRKHECFCKSFTIVVYSNLLYKVQALLMVSR